MGKRTRTKWMALLVAVFFLPSGCATTTGGEAAGGISTYSYINGEWTTDYNHSFDATWSACQKSISDLRGIDVDQDRTIGNGKIKAVVNKQDVRITVLYKAKNVTTVTIKVGMIGDKDTAQMIGDKISTYLSRK
jgi:hypothetical protein